MTAAPATTQKNADTRERLLLTALGLYAREGLHAVSLRRISAEAGSKNSAAMHYHFKNQRGVVHALLKMIMHELRDVAEALEVKEEHRSLRQACKEIVRPLVLLPSKQLWGADAVRFMSRLASENDPDMPPIINETYAPFLQRLDKAVAVELPDLPPTVRRLRLMFIHTNIFHGVAEVAWLTHTPLGDLSNFDEETLLGHLVDFLIGGLEAPSNANLATT